MLKALKTIGTVLTVASTVQLGKEVYGNYKDKKRKRQLQEVHEFISNLDINELQKAIESENTDSLVDAVESIIEAAESVRIKSEFEEISEDITESFKTVFSKVSDVAKKVADEAAEQFEKLDNEGEINKTPSFKEFLNGDTLTVTTKKGNIDVNVDDDNVSVKIPSRTVLIELEVDGKTKIKKIKLN